MLRDAESQVLECQCNDTIRYPVDHDQPGAGSSCLQIFPSKFSIHLADSGGGFIFYTDKSGSTLLDCF